MNIKNLLFTTALSIAVLLNQGCQTVPPEDDTSASMQTQSSEPMETASTTSARPDPGMSVGTISDGLVEVKKSVNKFATVGENLIYTYELTATTAVQDVVLEDMIPEGMTYITSSPAGSMDGDNISWVFDSMDEGQTQTVTMTLRADQVGSYRNCATITAIPVACTIVSIGEAKLRVIKTVERSEYRVGEQINYNIRVTNTGNATAYNVVLADNADAGIGVPMDLSSKVMVDGAPTNASASGNSIRIPVGDLNPGQTKTVTLPLLASSRGEFNNEVVASADNVVEDSDDMSEVPILVRIPGLEVEKTGTTEQFAGKRAQYEIVVSNTGDASIRDVLVVDTLPAEYRVTDADGGMVDSEASTITWNIPMLGGGEARTYNIEVVNVTGGRFCNNVTATAASDNLTDSAQACTDWEGYPALLLEVIDTVDPLLEGDNTTYVIRVTNQGTANDYNINIAAQLPPQIDPISITGATAGNVDGKLVTVTPVTTLAPKQTVEWVINARAVSLGDGRIFVRLDSELLKEVVTEEESTQVY